MSKQIEVALMKARSAEKRGDLALAAQFYRAILQTMPKHARAVQGLARVDANSTAASAAIAPSPAPTSAPQAENPGQQEIALLLQYSGEKRHEDAIAEGLKLIARYPESPLVCALLGASYVAEKRGQEAEPYYRRALEKITGVAELHNGMGDALLQLGDLENAFRHFSSAAEFAPDSAKAQGNMGGVFVRLNIYDQALEHYDRAIALNPNEARYFASKGSLFSRMKRHTDAVDSFERALVLNPRSSFAMVGKLFQQMKVCDWQAFETFEANSDWLGLEDDATPLLPMLIFADDPARQRRVAERFAESSFPIVEQTVFARPAERPERLRIGYFSADLREHPVMQMVSGMFRAHDPSRFDIHVYSFGGKDPHPARDLLATQVSALHEVTDLDEIDFIKLARSHNLAVAVDLMGPTQNARMEVLNHRLAPVQILFLGFPGTFATPFTDYLIADKVTIPTAERPHYAESLINLPHSFMPTDNQRAIAADAGTRADHGLPDHGVVLCCFNNSYKIKPAEFDIWCRVMAQVDGSVLWLRGDTADAEAALRREAGKRGIAAERLVFASRVSSIAGHLARHRHADLFLDTTAYNAHSTAVDALWAGLPVLTLVGRSFAARVAASLNLAIGMDELVTRTPAEYEALALALAQDPFRLAMIRQRLEQNRMTMPLFDTEAHTRNLEAAYDAVYARWMAGLPPTDIAVNV